jgi:hypothetical protein
LIGFGLVGRVSAILCRRVRSACVGLDGWLSERGWSLRGDAGRRDGASSGRSGAAAGGGIPWG